MGLLGQFMLFCGVVAGISYFISTRSDHYEMKNEMVSYAQKANVEPVQPARAPVAQQKPVPVRQPASKKVVAHN